MAIRVKDHRLVWGLLAAAVIGVAAGFLTTRTASPGDHAAAGLPRTSDYHSLLVAPSDPARLLLGTHQGLFGSSDGGRTWRKVGLSGHDAMNLARPSAEMIWVAGHNVFAKSTEGGETWVDVRP